MTITLTIRFSGLFLYTTRQGERSVWILAPETGRKAPMPMEDHVLKLQLFDAYNPKLPASAVNRQKFANVDVGRDIVIGDPGSPAAAAESVRQLPVPRLDGYAGRGPRADLFGAMPTALQSRVALHIGDMAGYTTGAQFRVRRQNGGSAVQEIVTDLYWTMQVPSVTIDGEERVRIDTRDLRGNSAGPILLRPVDGAVDVALHHVPLHHLPEPGVTHKKVVLKKGQPTPHFIALYGLYDEPQDIMLPLFEADAGPTTHGTVAHSFIEITGGEPVTCVGGGGGT
jgi:hypothetical protein